MFRALTLLILIFLTHASSAQNVSQDNTKWVKDWRLEKPFIHGFIGAISLNQFELFPEHWTPAQANEPNPLAPGSVEILEHNKTIPFTLGIVTGSAFILLIMIALYRSYKYRHVIKYFKKEMEKYNAI